MDPITPAALNALHEVKYPDFSEAEFSFFIEACRLRHLSPIGRHIMARREYNATTGRNEIITLLTLDGFRAVAAETGEYRGWIGPFFAAEGQTQWVDVWPGPLYPYAARFGVLRDGFRDFAYRVCLWDEWAQFDDDGQLLSFWRQMPTHMLGLRSEAYALRAAFPERLGGVYLIGEDGAPGELDALPGRIRDANSPGQHRRGPAVLTAEELEIELMDLGYETPDEQEKVIARVKGRYPLLAANNPEAFNARVLAETRPKRVIVPV